MNHIQLKTGVIISKPITETFTLSEIKKFIKNDGFPLPIRQAEIIDFSFKVVGDFVEITPFF